ncbi:MAG: T9SS type A sorting domain-containing protein, partial [Bacteroidia bacterium]
WDKYGSNGQCWNSGRNRNVTIRIRNLQTAGYGNDFGLDDVSFMKCCSSSATVTTVNMGPELVVNGDFSAGNTGFNSGHTYTTWYSPCNYYVDSIWFGSYFPGLTDHTPTNDNYFMHIDGCSPVTYVWEQTFTVTSNTIYNFEFWASLADVAQPNFEIHFIGDVTSAIYGPMPGSPFMGTWDWEKFDIGCWNSDQNRTVTIRVYNLETAGYGNDFGLDDFSFRQCCEENCCKPDNGSGRIAKPATDVHAVQLMPNPANDNTMIQIPEGIEATQVQIMDVTGRMILEVPVNSDKVNINTGALNNGMYFVRVVHTTGMLKAVPLTIQH